MPLIQVFVNNVAHDTLRALVRPLESGGVGLVEGERERIAQYLVFTYSMRSVLYGINNVMVHPDRVDITIDVDGERHVPVYVNDVLVPEMRLTVHRIFDTDQYIIPDIIAGFEYIRRVENSLTSDGQLGANQRVGHPVVSRDAIRYRTYYREDQIR
jgi:hypothetical protein